MEDKKREEEIRQLAEEYQRTIEENNPSAEAYDFFNAVIYGAEWADQNPKGLTWHDSEKEQPTVGSRVIAYNGENAEILSNVLSINKDYKWMYFDDILKLIR